MRWGVRATGRDLTDLPESGGSWWLTHTGRWSSDAVLAQPFSSKAEASRRAREVEGPQSAIRIDAARIPSDERPQ